MVHPARPPIIKSKHPDMGSVENSSNHPKLPKELESEDATHPRPTLPPPPIPPTPTRRHHLYHIIQSPTVEETVEHPLARGSEGIDRRTALH
jgi:hypothetical protein